MTMSNIKTSGFSLAKRKELTGDDYYEVKTLGDLTIAIVCDGVSSHIEGLLASQRVTNHLITNFKNRPISWSIEKCIKSFIKSINSILYQESMVNYEKPELITTLALIVIQGDKLYGANIGDSRIYLLRNNKMFQLSQDHCIENSEDENNLTQAIGLEKDVSPYYFENLIQKNDKILLCSDGLYKTLRENKFQNDIEFGANYLVKKVSSSVSDNLDDDTTAVVLEILQIDQLEKLKNLELPIPIELKVGQIIDGYTLEKSLIQNNRTWACSKNGKQYVLKFAPIEAIENKKILDIFVKEAWNSKRLKAGFFPKAVIPKKRSYRYYVQEAIDGVDLKTYLKKRRLHIDDVIVLAKTLLKTAQYLLKYDLVHADIRPENIMIHERDGKYIFKIVDFGSMTEIYTINNEFRNLSYLSPEIFEQNNINESTEIFAIGVTLYEALTGKFPYGKIESYENTSYKQCKSPKIFNDNIPLWLESIILRSLSSDVDKRYKNYSNMLFELENTHKVEPFFNKNVSLLEKNPLLVYKTGFYLMLLVNIWILLFFIK